MTQLQGGFMKIQSIADQINKYCRDRELFWAYGILKETYDLWTKDENKFLLCEIAHFMLPQIESIKAEVEFIKQ